MGGIAGLPDRTRRVRSSEFVARADELADTLNGPGPDDSGTSRRRGRSRGRPPAPGDPGLSDTELNAAGTQAMYPTHRPHRTRAAREAHLAGHRNRVYRLWAVLMFQTWLDANRTLLVP
jgi:hypothetical protein